MTPEILSKIIKDDMEKNYNPSKGHGIAGPECFVMPSIENFFDSFNNNQLIKLWLVYDEEPESSDRYLIVYSEEKNIFGLACKGKTDPGTFIGFYGSFTDTMHGM